MTLIYSPPTGHVLESMASQRIGWREALCEAIDNSLDAGATSIAVAIDGKKFISISDNGSGCAEPQAMVTRVVVVQELA
jgi:DNA gyrase/topoisomerase IV subunit B